MSAKAECTWGLGPDVLIVIAVENTSGFPLIQHGDGQSSFGLTAAEARKLAAQMIVAAERTEGILLDAAQVST
jgi:hypothetical protein